MKNKLKFEHPILSIPFMLVGAIEGIIDAIKLKNEKKDTCYELKEALKSTGKLYYIVDHYEINENVLIQCVDFYVLYQEQIWNADVLISLYIKIKPNSSVNTLAHGAYILDSNSIACTEKIISEKTERQIKLIRINNESLPEGATQHYLGGGVSSAYTPINMNKFIELPHLDINTIMTDNFRENTKNLSNFDEKEEKIIIKSKINLSSCNKEELLTIDCFNDKDVERFILERENGKIYYDIETFCADYGIKPHQMLELQNRLIFPLKPKDKIGRKIDW